jgi:hypothetical protein
VKKALSDHTGGVCAHEKDPIGRELRTIWSLVGVLGEHKIEIAEGHPCEEAYHTVHIKTS